MYKNVQECAMPATVHCQRVMNYLDSIDPKNEGVYSSSHIVLNNAITNAAYFGISKEAFYLTINSHII